MLIPNDKPWESLLNSLDQFSDDFLETRNQPKQQGGHFVKIIDFEKYLED